MFNKITTFHFIVLCLFVNSTLAHNKIVYLISPPRSLSVAFLRMMEARKDFRIMNEPSEWAYDVNRHYELTKDWFYSDAFKTFEEVKQKIFREAKHSNVFVKEISFAVKNFLLNDSELIKNNNVYFVFLIRNPHHSIISFYNKTLKIVDGFSDLVGYKAAYEIFQHIKKESPNMPLIILSEDLYNDPQATIKTFCNHVQIPYNEQALTWSDLGTDFSGVQEWHEIKRKELTHHWHGEAIRSSGFAVPRSYCVGNDGPTFEEIKDPKDREICEATYKENLHYYNLLRSEL